jgi:hypothetical protein
MARGGIGRIPVSARPKVMQKRGAADRQREARSSYAERRGRTIIRQLVERLSSVITLKPAIRYQFKTGQRDWPET